MSYSASLMNSEIKFTLSTKGKKILLYDGYRYVLNQKKMTNDTGDVKMVMVVEHMFILHAMISI